MRGCRQGRPVASLFVCRPPSLGGRYPEKVNSPRELSVDADTSGSRLADPPHRKGRRGSSGPKGSPPLAHTPLPFPASSLNGGQGRLLPSTPRCLDLGPPIVLPQRSFQSVSFGGAAARVWAKHACAPNSADPRPLRGARTWGPRRRPQRPTVGGESLQARQGSSPSPTPPRKPWTIIIVGSPCPP